MKIAIIGLGVIGKVHAEALALLGTPATVLCDIDQGALLVARDAFAKDAALYTDWEVMLREAKPDVVHICTPHYLHAPMVIAALRANINVLCEKPLCIREEDIAEILEAEAASTASLGVCHQNRYNDVNVFLKEYLAERRVLGAHGAVTWQRTKEYYASAAWRGTWAYEGGGALINQALHTLDLLLWLCGEPQSLVATKDNLTLKGDIEVEDTVALRAFGEVPFSFFATVGAGVSFPVTLQFQLEGGDHLLVQPKVAYLNGKPLATGEIKRVLGKACYGDGHLRLFSHYYDCLAKGEHFPIDGKEAAKVIRVILRTYQSEGRVLPLKETKN